MPATPVNRRRKTPKPKPIEHDSELLRLDEEASLYRGLISGQPYPFPPGDTFAQRIAASAGAYCESNSLADKRAVPSDDGRPQHYPADGDDETPPFLSILGTMTLLTAPNDAQIARESEDKDHSPVDETGD